MEESERLIERLDQGRRTLQAMMIGLDPRTEICPGWTIKEILAHIAGWDEVATSALRAHAAGTVPAALDPPGIDAYNDLLVHKYEALSHEEMVQVWRQARRELKNALTDMPVESLHEPMLYPWGERGNAARIVAILAEHEKEHAAEIRDLNLEADEEEND
jgi:hypothetical protein